MHTSRLEKDKKVQDNVIKDIRNLFRQKSDSKQRRLHCK